MKIGITGSRAFGTATPESDIDLFMQDSPETRRNLMAMGFRELPIRGKGGPNMTSVFRRANVDVALQANIDRKIRENETISRSPLRFLMRLPKEVRELVWSKVQRI